MTRNRLIAAASLAASVALLLTACSGKDNTGSSAPASTSSPASSAASAGSGSATGSASSGPAGSATAGSSGAGSATSSAPAGNVCTGKSGTTVPTKLVLALVPSGDASKLVESVKPLTDALTKSLGIPVSGVVTQDYQAAVEAIGANQADIGFLPSLQMSQACDKYGAPPVLQTLRNGKSSYAAQFFTNKAGQVLQGHARRTTARACSTATAPPPATDRPGWTCCRR
jgi:phosphonate transport system substrate-binding protein